ncbi:cell division protein [Pseudomonas sp. B1(2018)]|uniref:SPOR domain-containing protein n=1 Tax=Pseudomonas sp. B1(2018) TaxID=2233856 RepID=UPI000D5CE302|nr:SPOR domain-containing protein [Pseudomonas sp. B1(2018)]PVZ55554.1 cell division protein [Pseudomonas sp. B1(2018)]
MALLDKAYKQRMVGALVLVALAVIFLPMLFSRQDEQRQVTVEAPAAPQAPALPQVQVEPVAVPEPQALPQEPVPSDDEIAQQESAVPAVPVAPAPAPAAKPVTPPPAPAPAPVPALAAKPATAPAQPITAAPGKPDTTQSRVDANGLSVSWSVQLASLANRESAEKLQKTLRSQGYNAYIRTADGKNRVFVGPLIERAEADRLRDLLNRQQNLKGFVVRFQPERG